jgi:hypothetical protein
MELVKETTFCSSPWMARQELTRHSTVRRMPAPLPRDISSNTATARMPGEAFSIGCRPCLLALSGS